MNPTTTAYGTWSGGRFMHFGETLDEDRFIRCIETAYQSGIRTFVTSDVYGNGKADELLGRALAGIDRSTYSLVGMIGHDFYHGSAKAHAATRALPIPNSADPRAMPTSCTWRPRRSSSAVAAITLIYSCCTIPTNSAIPVRRFGMR